MVGVVGQAVDDLGAGSGLAGARAGAGARTARRGCAVGRHRDHPPPDHRLGRHPRGRPTGRARRRSPPTPTPASRSSSAQSMRSACSSGSRATPAGGGPCRRCRRTAIIGLGGRRAPRRSRPAGRRGRPWATGRRPRPSGRRKNSAMAGARGSGGARRTRRPRRPTRQKARRLRSRRQARPRRNRAVKPWAHPRQAQTRLRPGRATVGRPGRAGNRTTLSQRRNRRAGRTGGPALEAAPARLPKPALHARRPIRRPGRKEPPMKRPIPKAAAAKPPARPSASCAPANWSATPWSRSCARRSSAIRPWPASR